VSVEPISGIYRTDANPMWVNTIYNQMGYGADSTIWDKGRHLNGDRRALVGTDWAFTIFVGNSVSDADGLFSDNWSAYSYQGGPFAVLTYDNGSWGISRMNEVMRHEASHVFYALDEYASSVCTCTESSGYVHYRNTNCNELCSMNVACVMRDTSNVVCNSTRGMIGWWDFDSDNWPDPVDIPPETALAAYGPDPTTDTVLIYTGTGTIQALTNQNIYHYRCDMNVLNVGNVQWRVDSGPWSVATPVDGVYNGKSEAYTFTTGSLGGGTHLIETRTIDSSGQADPTPAQDYVTVILGPPAVPSGLMGTPMTAQKVDAAATQIDLSWDGTSCPSSNFMLIWGWGGRSQPTPAAPTGLAARSAPCLPPEATRGRPLLTPASIPRE